MVKVWTVVGEEDDVRSVAGEALEDGLDEVEKELGSMKEGIRNEAENIMIGV